MFQYVLAACLCLGAVVAAPASFVQSASAQEQEDDLYLCEDGDYDVYGFFDSEDAANRYGAYLRRHKGYPGWAVVPMYTFDGETGMVIFALPK